MDYSEAIKTLYLTVFRKQNTKFSVSTRAIIEGIKNLGDAYLPNRNWEFEYASKTTDFRNAGHRSAYLLKYAMIHTGLVCDVLQQAFQVYSVKRNIDSKQSLNVCSLGSGPGTDIVALLFALKEKFRFKRCSASLIDCSIQWEHVFEAVVSELRTTAFVEFNAMMDHFNYRYLACDLLTFGKVEVYREIGNADLVTMIKFLSAAACRNTRNMIKKICNEMKPGAMLLFVDNAAGGFYEILSETAELYGLESLFGPLKHYKYEEKNFQLQWNNYTSQYETKVTVEMWVKSRQVPERAYDQVDCVQKQCANINNEYDETDNSSFQLQSEDVAKPKKESNCCIIM